jgi:hypothetical protein
MGDDLFFNVKGQVLTTLPTLLQKLCLLWRGRRSFFMALKRTAISFFLSIPLLSPKLYLQALTTQNCTFSLSGNQSIDLKSQRYYALQIFYARLQWECNNELGIQITTTLWIITGIIMDSTCIWKCKVFTCSH